MTRWSAITRTRGRRSALAYGSRSTTAAENNLNRRIHHQRGRYSLNRSFRLDSEGATWRGCRKLVWSALYRTAIIRLGPRHSACMSGSVPTVVFPEWEMRQERVYVAGC
jgi:hypothetical protein